MSKNNNFKDRIGVVYSTSDDFDYEEDSEFEEESLPPNKQSLKVLLDKKNRGGKQVTLVTGFVGKFEDLKDLGKLVKSKCGVGGNVKGREIIIQGDLRDKVAEILEKEGYRVKRV